MKRAWFLAASLSWVTMTVAQTEPAAAVEVQNQSSPEAPANFEAIPKELHGAYFSKRPAKFLLDPQRLLAPVVGRDRAAFLDYHADDSKIDLYLMVIGGHQEVDEEQMRDFMARCYDQGEPAVVLVYPWGAVQRTTLWLSRQVAEGVSEPERRRALETSMIQAMEKADPMDQLEALLVQMSIRVYWMERAVGLVDRVEPVKDDLPPVMPPKPEKPGWKEKFAPMFEIARQWTEEAAMGSGMVFMIIVLVAWRRARARYVFPDFGVEPRLGGEHGAGVGAVISFASADLPPAAQRDDADEYFRRL